MLDKTCMAFWQKQYPVAISLQTQILKNLLGTYVYLIGYNTFSLVLLQLFIET